MPQIDLQAYWGPISFYLDCQDLKSLRDYLARGQTGVITIGAWNFNWQNGSLYFADSGNPEEYYIDMTASAIIAVIDAAIAEFCR